MVNAKLGREANGDEARNRKTHCLYQPLHPATLTLGVLLDTLPYLVILAVVAGGVALLMLRKRRKEDD